MNKLKFIIGQNYTARDITGGQYYGIYDQLIALVDGKLEHLTDWLNEILDEEQLTYDEALDTLLTDVWAAYEGAKNIIVFNGIPPEGKRGFDVFTNYKCISNEEL